MTQTRTPRGPATDGDVPAYWRGLGLPGLADIHIHFLPPPTLAAPLASVVAAPAAPPLSRKLSDAPPTGTPPDVSRADSDVLPPNVPLAGVTSTTGCALFTGVTAKTSKVLTSK